MLLKKAFNFFIIISLSQAIIFDKCMIMDTSYIENFEKLTKKALKEEDIDKFIDLLMQRDAYSEYIMDHNIAIIAEEAQNYLLQEEKVIQRLEDERKKLLTDMDELSKSKAVMRTYSPKFPFPPLPVFFEKKG
ncbi:MAG: hypothetical protein NT010_09560 [Proteobacteria bacterium]|nr:hypothetical protein [Pseudomonadota bacterium]